jgi:sulfatase maturation enzyme AslB (radical SAM superfamily)
MDILMHDLTIEPIGTCNLNCKSCYVRKKHAFIPKEKVLDFVTRYLEEVPGPLRLFWIGRGEITLYKDFAELVNYFSATYPDRISHLIQTNGILIGDVAKQFERVDNVVVSISIDGPREAHDLNRGEGTFDTIISNVRTLLDLDIKVQVQTLLLPENIREIHEFAAFLHDISPDISIQYLPPLVKEDVEVLDPDSTRPPAMTREDVEELQALLETPEYRDIKENTGEIGLTRYITMSCEGYIYNCCEFQVKIGGLETAMPTLLDRLRNDRLCLPCNMKATCFPEKW